MRQKYFINPFGTGGTITPVIPDAADPSGYVSYEEGWTFDYQRNLVTDPLAKSPTYVNFNALGNDITVNLQDYQQNGAPEFITSSNNGGSAFSYRIGALMRYSASGNPPFDLYVNTVDNNVNPPTGNGWVSVTGLATNSSGFINAVTPALITLTNTGNWTCPTNVFHVRPSGQGAGGGGGGGAAGTDAGGGGGGGGYFSSWMAVTPGTAYSYSVGGGGSGGTPGNNGVNGGDTVFAGFTAHGGTAGSGATVGNVGVGGSGGAVSGSPNAGSGGGDGLAGGVQGSTYFGGAGGWSYGGVGATVPSFGGTGVDGGVGAGGSGGANGGGGGTGGNGELTLEYFITPT